MTTKRDYLITVYATKQRGSILLEKNPVIRKTEKGISDYANRMYSKHFDNHPDMTVEVGYFNDDYQWVTTHLYHA